MLRICDKRDLFLKSPLFTIKKISEKLYAKKGTYKTSYIEVEDGRRYPSSIVRSYQDYFEKV